MKKLTKNDILRRDDMVEKLQTKYLELNQARDTVNEAIGTMNETIASYNELLNEISGWRDDIVSQMDTYIDERSDKWRDESEAGAEYDEWRAEFENLDLEEIDKIDNIEFTEPSHAEEVEGLPEQPG